LRASLSVVLMCESSTSSNIKATDLIALVFESPVRSGFFPFLAQTGTATGS
jgi:hypothetical protein